MGLFLYLLIYFTGKHELGMRYGGIFTTVFVAL